MKIWITRHGAFSLQVGGIDRLQVWFREPVWTESEFYTEKELCFGSYMQDGCYAPKGWGIHGGKIQHSVPFGPVFGYEGEFSEWVWNKLCSHFGNVDMRQWDKYENENNDCSVRNFMLVTELDIIFKPIK